MTARVGRKLRDLSDQQFLDALKAEGFGPLEVMGYVNLGIPGRRIVVSIVNAGDRHRDQLAYLRRQRRRYVAQQEAK